MINESFEDIIDWNDIADIFDIVIDNHLEQQPDELIKERLNCYPKWYLDILIHRYGFQKTEIIFWVT
jgi:hypothetical protein